MKKKSFFKVGVMVFLLCFIMAFSSVDVFAVTSTPKPKQETMDLYKGYVKKKITFVGVDSNCKITFRSNNTKIAKVDTKGYVTPVNIGKTTISITIQRGAKKYNSKVAIFVHKPYIATVSGINIVEGDRKETTVSIVGVPTDSSSKFIWEVGEAEKVSMNVLNKKGSKISVLGKQAGTTKLIVKDSKSGIRQEIDIKVNEKEKDFRIENPLEDFWCDVDYRFKVVNTKNHVIWSVSNNNIAKIDQDGIFTGLHSGTVVVTAMDSVTKEEKQCTVYLKEAIETKPEYLEYRENSLGEIIITGVKNVSLDTIQIPEKIYGKTVVALDEKGFEMAKDLRTVVIPSTVNYVFEDMFRNCYKLHSIVLLNRKNPVDLVGFIGKGTELEEFIMPYKCPMTLTDVSQLLFHVSKVNQYILPEGIEEINTSEGLFLACSNMTIILPDSLKKINGILINDILGGKNNTIIIPKSVNYINKDAFGKDPVANNVVLKVEKGSYAEQYAIKNGLLYEY